MWEGVALLDFKNFYEAMAIKTLGHFQRKRQIDKQYRKETRDGVTCIWKLEL